jgi:hypothetical protein
VGVEARRRLRLIAIVLIVPFIANQVTSGKSAT